MTYPKIRQNFFQIFRRRNFEISDVGLIIYVELFTKMKNIMEKWRLFAITYQKIVCWKENFKNHFAILYVVLTNFPSNENQKAARKSSKLLNCFRIIHRESLVVEQRFSQRRKADAATICYGNHRCKTHYQVKSIP